MAGKRSFTYSGDDHTDKMVPGWLLPYLLELDTFTMCDRGTIPEEDIPHINFTGKPDREDERHIQDALRTCVNKGYWYDDAWLAFVRWLLHGFGRKE